MPVTKSAKKALRKEGRRRAVNLKIKKGLKEAIVKFKKNPTSKNLGKAASALDKAAKKKVIHKKTAARLKSKLAKMI